MYWEGLSHSCMSSWCQSTHHWAAVFGLPNMCSGAGTPRMGRGKSHKKVFALQPTTAEFSLLCSGGNSPIPSIVFLFYHLDSNHQPTPEWETPPIQYFIKWKEPPGQISSLGWLVFHLKFNLFYAISLSLWKSHLILKQSKELTWFLRWKGNDEAKSSLLSIRVSELSKLTTLVGVNLRNE